MSRWYFTPDNRQRLGPVTSQELRQLALSGTLRPEHMVALEGAGKWMPAGTVEGFFGELAEHNADNVRSQPPPLPIEGVPVRDHVHDVSPATVPVPGQAASMSAARPPSTAKRLGDDEAKRVHPAVWVWLIASGIVAFFCLVTSLVAESVLGAVLAILVAPIVVGLAILSFYAKPTCPACGARWGAWPVWVNSRKDGGADLRYKHNARVCSNCGHVYTSY